MVPEPGYLPNDEKTLVLLYIAGENHCEVLHNCALSAAFLIGSEKKNWLIEPYHVIFGLTLM